MKTHLIEKNSKLELVLRYAKRMGKLKFSPQTLEFQEAAPYTKKRHGYSSEDIDGFLKPSLSLFLRSNYDSFLDDLEDFGFWKALGGLRFKFPWSSWVWVVDSKSSIALSVAMDKFRGSNKSFDSILIDVSQEEIMNHLHENYNQVSAELWLSKKDASIFVYDESFKPFKLEDGWSKEQLGEVIEEWYEFIAEEKIKSEFVN